MLNYMKSEIYRAVHSPAVYITALVFAAMPLCLNLVLYAFGAADPGFPYATTSFSFSNVAANPMIFAYGALVVVYVLYEGSRKNGSMKNAVAYGIARHKIFAVQCIVSFLVSLVLLCLTEAVYVGSAYLLLEEQGAVNAADMAGSAVAAFPVAAAALVLGVVSVQAAERGFAGLVIWLCVMSFIPQGFLYLGLQVDALWGAAMWMPHNFFSTMTVNQSVCEAVWDTGAGLARCWIAGAAGIVIFSAIGLYVMRKKEL